MTQFSKNDEKGRRAISKALFIELYRMKREHQQPFNDVNKAGYTAKEVACGWAVAVMIHAN